MKFMFETSVSKNTHLFKSVLVFKSFIYRIKNLKLKIWKTNFDKFLIIGPFFVQLANYISPLDAFLHDLQFHPSGPFHPNFPIIIFFNLCTKPSFLFPF